MDQQYFDRVYETTYRPLLKYAIIHLSDPTDAEDALQNVYLAFYRRVERYGHLDVLFPKAFLLKMLKREIIEQYAEREKHAVRLLEDVPEERLRDDWVFEDGVLDRALAEDILAEAKRLPRETYRIFVLYYGYELTVSKIAKELGMGAEAVKSRLFRGRKAIRAYLTAEDAGSESGR
ncbi:MAG: sigma-70 family RNA polymerase sigma factor [Clostridia bacterium]|nr:sigma-70 family RNA polymerase sigma factor [Clostridia bacterium]MBQ9924003.1 sigma-70 family RNA polymerase sigma factor [Clostridia bacterium]MBR0205755.1 sigma-70 family RNA polymerase sigma factor [Clostridia bacterium]